MYPFLFHCICLTFDLVPMLFSPAVFCCVCYWLYPLLTLLFISLSFSIPISYMFHWSVRVYTCFCFRVCINMSINFVCLCAGLSVYHRQKSRRRKQHTCHQHEVTVCTEKWFYIFAHTHAHKKFTCANAWFRDLIGKWIKVENYLTLWREKIKKKWNVFSGILTQDMNQSM